MSQFLAFWNSLDRAAMLAAALRLLAVLLCLTVHETSHGLAAYALGDPTAKTRHRLSLNPLHHIDWLGLAAMLMLGFGWAKPVPVNMRSFRNPKRGMALTALAGPVSNLLLAFLLLAAARLTGAGSPDSMALDLLFRFFLIAAQLSVGLGVFNLLPISPLDGSKVLFALLPERAYEKLMYYERYGMILLCALLFFGVLDGLLGRLVQTVFGAMLKLVFYLR